MTFEIAEVLQIIGLFITFVVAIAGNRKSKSERDKLEAETAVLYANLSAEGAKRETEMQKKIDELSSKLKRQDETIADLKEVIEKKDARIGELETLTKAQEKEIQGLRTELNTIRRNIK
jgi:uncharacterized coiled-coil protein SlyX